MDNQHIYRKVKLMAGDLKANNNSRRWDSMPTKQHSTKDISVTLMVASLLGGDNVPSKQHYTKDYV
jgi:hypothetical protein